MRGQGVSLAILNLILNNCFMKNNRLTILLLALSFASPVGAAMGDWHVYQTIDNYWRIEQLSNQYYLLNGHSLFVADVDQLDDVRSLSRVDGLNGNIVNDIVAFPSLSKLAVVYSDGNIDMLGVDGQVSNLPDYANYSIQADRSILGIGATNDTLCVRTGFGALLVDMRSEVIRRTLYDGAQDDSAMLQHCIEVVAAHQNSESLQALLDKMPNDNGTKVCEADQMTFAHHRLYVVSSCYEDYTNTFYGTPDISIFNTETDEWFNYNIADLHNQATAIDPYAWANYFSAIAVDPNDPFRIYVSAHKGSGGIFQLDGEKLTGLYNARLRPDEMCSVLNGTERDQTLYTWVSAMQPDDDGSLWFTNGNKESNSTLRRLTKSGQIISYPTSTFTGYFNKSYCLFGRLRISKHCRYPFKWIVRTFSINSAAVCIYDDGGTADDLSDDNWKTFSSLTDQDGNVYKPTYFRDLVEDRNGAMWLLTSIGPFVIDNQISAFNNPGNVRRIKIPRTDGSNLADYLLGEVSCRCMVVDAANRKWIGTDEAGLYLLSPDGLTTLAHFTTENSPLFTNRIGGLAMDEETGTLYIGMNGGICAYETDVLPDVPDNEGLYCYPNPVRADYTGDLTIAGFQDGSTVTVTDALHHVVMRQKSEGAVIRWNLEGNDGRRVAPGIYYVDAIGQGGRQGKSFKIMVF